MASAYRFCGLIFGLLGLSYNTQASIIAQPVFSPTATVESFEGIAGQGNDFPINTPFSFSTGVVLTGPVPSSAGSFGPFIVEGGFFGLGGGVAPHGAADLGQANPNLLTGPLEFTFATPVLRGCVRIHHGYVKRFECNRDHASDKFQRTVARIRHDFEYLTNTMVIQFCCNPCPEMIAKLKFVGDTGGVLRIDDLSFEVPEPCGLSLLTSGLLFVLQRRRRIA